LFPNPGSYEVELREGEGGSLVGTIVIEVFRKPNLDFAADPSTGCSPLAVNFEDLTNYTAPVTVNNYTWTYGDGGSSMESSPTYTYTDQGSYSVSMQVATNFPSCDTTIVKRDLIEVGERVVADFSISPGDFNCTAPYTVNFENLSDTGPGITYLWDFGNGETSTDFNPLGITYTEDGFFPVQLTVTSAEANCSNTVTKTITIAAPALRVNFSDTLCFESVNSLAAIEPDLSYEWNFGPDATPASSTSQRVDVEFSRPGFHDIDLTIAYPGGGCPNDTTFRVWVQDLDMSFTKDPAFSCEVPVNIDYSANGTGGSFLWDFPDQGIQLFGRNASRIVESPDTNYFHQVGPFFQNGRLVRRSTAGCIEDTLFVVSFLLPFAVLLVDDHDGCAPHEVEFDFFTQSREDIVRYELHFGDGTVEEYTADDPVNYSYTQEGEYEAFVIIENSAGCLDTSVIALIEVGVPIDADFSAAGIRICQDDVVNFSVDNPDPRVDAWHYRSEGEQLSACDESGNISYRFNEQAGFIDVTLVVEYNGCVNEITREDYIEMIGPVADFEYAIDCSDPFTVNITNTSQNANDITWLQLGSDPEFQNEEFSVEYDRTGNYNITLRAFNTDNGCPPDFENKQIYIRDVQAEIELANSFGLLQDEPYRLCAEEDYFLDGYSNSIDVAQGCRQAYRWFFSESLDKQDFRTFGPTSLDRFTLTDEGPHEITLVVEDINGCFDTASVTIEPYEQNVDFTISDSLVCLPVELTFESNSSGDTSIVDYLYQFEFGPEINDSVVTRAFPDDGQDTLEVTHIVTDAVGCRDTSTKNVIVYEPVTDISYDRFRRICTDETVTVSATDFTDQGSFLLYDWTIADSTNSQFDTSTFDISFSEEGLYFIDLIIEEEATGCETEYRDTIFVQDFPQAGFSTNVDTSSILCNPTTILFNDTTVTNNPYSQLWLVDGEPAAEDNANPGFTFEKGIHEVQLISTTSYSCADTSALRIFEVVGPEGDAVPDSAILCLGDTVVFNIRDTLDVGAFSWNFGDGTSVDNESPVSHSYSVFPPGGRTTATLTLEGAEGECTLVRSVPVRILDVVADFIRNDGMDTAICLGAYPFVATSDNVDRFEWNFGDGGSGTGDSVSHTYNTAGFYDVQLFVSNDSLGCTDSTRKTVQLYPLPEPMAVGDTICQGDTALLQVVNPSALSFYDWPSDPELVANQSIRAFVNPSSSRPFTLVEEDSLGCEGTADVFVDVIEPIQGFVWDTSIVIGDTAFLPFPVNPLFTYEWEHSNGLSCLSCPQPSIQILQDEFFSLSVSDVLNCFETPFSYNITVIDEEKIRVPNTFTPNGDGINDIVYAEGWAIKELQFFRIFNEWGEKVFDSNDLNRGWDGTHKGEPQNPGVYTWQVQAVSWRNDNIMTAFGHIELVR
jgi:gliding motility-associated-like protein